MTKFDTTFRVYYEDTDAGGVVYYANFLKFVERARSDLFRTSGLDHVKMAEKYNSFYVVRKAEVEYLLPGRLDDLITVKTDVVNVGKTSVTMSQNCYNQHGDKLADVTVQIVCVRNEGDKIRSVRMPEELIKFFSA